MIGNEIREGLALTGHSNRYKGEAITLIGSESLCERYLIAFQQLGIKAVSGPGDAVVPGFQQLIATIDGNHNVLSQR